MNHFIWLIRREFWENRAVWLVPAAIGAFLLVAALFGTVHFDFAGPDLLQSPAPGPVASTMISGILLLSIAGLFFVVMSIYSSWYLLDCLHAERKDRSILFWKSLPVSDTATVLSKLCMGLVIIPIVYWLFADAASLFAAFVLSVRSRSLFTAGLWQPTAWLQLQGLWLYVVVTLAVWYLPVAGWFMLVSAWARRAVMLWSLLPPLALILAERILTGSHRLLDLAAHRLLDGYYLTAFHSSGASSGAVSIPDFDAAVAHYTPGSAALASPIAALWHELDPLAFASSSATWIGAGLGVALIALTIQVRQRHAEV